MGYKDEKLWKCLKEKVRVEDEKMPENRQIGNRYLIGVEDICQFGVERAITIRDTFPMYTLHDETHICNVLRLMADLLGNRIDDLTRDETAMLLMAACCHDVGMSYSEEEKEELLKDHNRLEYYLERNRGEYIKAYSDRTDEPKMTNDMIQNYLRSLHHERVKDLLINKDWSPELERWVNRKDLTRVCQSHGMDISALDGMDATSTIDLRLCAVLLRLADILDFDTSRAPKTVYKYSGFDKKEGDSARISEEEWNKHLSSDGFDFVHIKDRSYPYLLNYSARSESMQIEQVINSYLDWVDQELADCRSQMERYAGEWHDLVLPLKIKRNIEKIGYASELYRLSLDHSKVMELLVGRDLYNDPAVFVRELLQNAIDAVRTREKLDKNLPANWKPQINIRTWMDEEGYHWFRIEDNGTGMSEEIILNYLLKVGRSYYTSDLFEQDKIRCKVDPNYTPISRFGIGILSCFMGDEGTNQVEISTKRFCDGLGDHSALRLSLHGIEGFYYMAKKKDGHNPELMKGVTTEEKKPYLEQAGTVIAVRTNLYFTGKYNGFKEIVDKYVFFPEVSIHYDGEDGSINYCTEAELMEDIYNFYTSNNRSLQNLLPEKKLEMLKKDIPELCKIEFPKIYIKCIIFNQYIENKFLAGATFLIEESCNDITFRINIDNEEVTISLHFIIDLNLTYDTLKISLEALRVSETKYTYKFGDNNIKTQIEKYFPKGVLFECNLNEFFWYHKYFKPIFAKTKNSKVLAHNGILCGNVDSFFHPAYYTLGTVLLLKDKFRPNLDISRSRISGISLEMLCMIDTMLNSINREREHITLSHNVYNELESPYICAKKYWDILDKQEYMIKNFIFPTIHGNYSVEMIQQAINSGQKITLSIPKLKKEGYNNQNYLFSISILLDLAYLRKNYIMHISFISNSFQGANNNISIIGKGCDMPENLINILPPYFFLFPSEKDCPYLTTKNLSIRCSCNAMHRFSQFIFSNCEQLVKYARGFLRQILHSLLEDDYIDAIDKINDILDCLRKFPNDLFIVTNDIYLTENDFI